jgi:hypothetical protein
MRRDQFWVIGDERDADDGGVCLNRRLQKCGLVTGLAALVADWIRRVQGRTVFMACSGARALKQPGQ